MDHRFIDENAIAERYLKHSLDPHEVASFEEHMVDCQECQDRVLLAEMFRLRRGKSKPWFAPMPLPTEPVAQSVPKLEQLPFRARFVAAINPWVLAALIFSAALLLVMIPSIVFYWKPE
jgi:hypothetical protein